MGESSLTDLLSAIGTVAAAAVAAIAVIVNNRTTRWNLESQERANRAALVAQAQMIRDERVWEKRIELYEQLSEWVDRCLEDLRMLKFWWYEPRSRMPPPDESLASKEWVAECDAVQDKHFPRYVELRSIVNLYGETAVRTAFEEALPNPMADAYALSPGALPSGGPYKFQVVADSIQQKDEKLCALQDAIRHAINQDRLVAENDHRR